jgi:hypothetical protein
MAWATGAFSWRSQYGHEQAGTAGSDLSCGIVTFGREGIPDGVKRV